MLTQAPPEPKVHAREGLWQRAGGASGVGLAAIIFVLLRVAQLILVEWMSPGGSLGSRLMLWDSGWFINVAVEGYPEGYTYDAQGTMVGNGFAFFPLFPWLIDFISLFGVPPEGSSLFIVSTAGIAAAAGIYLFSVALWGSRDVGYLLVVLVCAQPMSVVMVMGYTEPLFLALVVFGLLAAHQRVWWAAGVAGVAAALTRPTGAALAIALSLAVILAWRTSTPRERWIGSIGAGLSLLAGPAYLAWVGWRVGEWDAWFKVQTAGWGSTFDGGAAVGTFIINTLHRGTGIVDVLTVWFIVAAVIFAGVAVAQRLWPPLVMFGLISLVLVIGQAGYWHSKPRLLIPVLLLACVPIARSLATAPRRTTATVIALWTAFGLWFGAHMITVWPYTI